jgi:hypothetical protein
MMAKHERAAEPVEQPESIVMPELVTGVRERKKQLQSPHPVSRLSLYTAIGGLAAMFLTMAYVMLNPRNISRPVATLKDSLEARWEKMSLETGTRLANDDSPIKLLSGCARLQFDSGAEVILEGPAEFQLITDEQLWLTQGQLSVFVPPSAAGFRVDTPAMSVIDLGTEFSVKIAPDGLAAVHLHQGMASFLTGEVGKRRNNDILTSGQARSLDPLTGEIARIPIDQNGFIRRFDSQKGFVWRGEPIDLAGIVAGGDGFNPRRGIAGIDPATGHHVTKIKYDLKFSNAVYNLVPDNPFVDGVFIPDGGLGDVVISSAGHVFRDCPDTAGVPNNSTGAITHDILTLCDYDRSQLPKARADEMPVFNRVAKGTVEDPVVLMHSNVGITFDLQAIRKHLSGIAIERFVCSFGFPDMPDAKNPRSEVWVLVDGRLKFEKRELTLTSGVLDMAVDIAPAERFLTIVVTDAMHMYEPGERTCWYDFMYLIHPRLVLRSIARQP